MVILCGGPSGLEIAAFILSVALLVLVVILFRRGAEERKLDKEIRMNKKTLELKKLKKDLEE